MSLNFLGNTFGSKDTYRSIIYARKYVNKALLTLLITFLLVTNSEAQPHVHDKGAIFVMQQGNMWNIQFVMPAVNAFGFEHEPKTSTQKNKISDFIKTISNVSNVFIVSNACSLTSFEEDISQNYIKAHHSTNDHKSHDHMSHRDASFSYTLKCHQPISELQITLFNQLNDLEAFAVQWITENGQGAAQVLQNSSKLSF